MVFVARWSATILCTLCSKVARVQALPRFFAAFVTAMFQWVEEQEMSVGTSLVSDIGTQMLHAVFVKGCLSLWGVQLPRWLAAGMYSCRLNDPLLTMVNCLLELWGQLSVVAQVLGSVSALHWALRIPHLSSTGVEPNLWWVCFGCEKNSLLFIIVLLFFAWWSSFHVSDFDLSRTFPTSVTASGGPHLRLPRLQRVLCWRRRIRGLFCSDLGWGFAA